MHDDELEIGVAPAFEHGLHRAHHQDAMLAPHQPGAAPGRDDDADQSSRVQGTHETVGSGNRTELHAGIEVKSLALLLDRPPPGLPRIRLGIDVLRRRAGERAPVI